MLRESSERRVDHLLRTERFAATDAGEDLRFVENARRLGARCDIELRDQRDRAFGTGVLTNTALDALRFDEAKLRRECIVEDRAFGTRADAGQAHRACVAVDGDRSERRARRQRNRLPRHRCVRGEMVNGERERRPLVGGRRKCRGNARRQRNRPNPQRALERLYRRAVDEPEMLALIAERVRNRIAQAHLKSKRVAILGGDAFARQHGDT